VVPKWENFERQFSFFSDDSDTNLSCSRSFTSNYSNKKAVRCKAHLTVFFAAIGVVPDKYIKPGRPLNKGLRSRLQILD
jgi:hypothetical protein